MFLIKNIKKYKKNDLKYNYIFIAMPDSETKTGLITGLTLGMLAVLFIMGSALVYFRLR